MIIVEVELNCRAKNIINIWPAFNKTDNKKILGFWQVILTSFQI